ncbi:hypothetical protein D9M72_435810 [compost metagenome]
MQRAVAYGRLDRNQIHRRVADEICDESGRRPAINLDRRGELHDPSLIHDGDAGCERHRFRLVVGDVDGGHAHVALQMVEEAAGFEAQLGVEVRERLVEEVDLAWIDQCAGQRRALLLAAGDLARQPLHQVADLEDVGHFLGAGVALGLLLAAHLQGIGDVVGDVHVRVERIVLKDHGNAAVLRMQVGNVAAADHHPARGWRFETRDHAQARRLAAARRAQQADELAVGDLEADVGHGDEGAEGLGDVLEFDRGHDRFPITT